MTNWHILGAGAIGCLWATALVNSGQSVTLILRNQDALDRFTAAKGSILLKTTEGEQSVSVSAQLAPDVRQIRRLLVTTKAHATLEAVSSVEHALLPNTELLLLQNGMGPQQQLATSLKQAIWAGSTTDGVWVEAPFCIVQAGHGVTRIGPLNNSTPLPSALPEQLTLQADAQIEQTLWHKLAINCAINPLTALHQCCNGELLTKPVIYQRFKKVCEEIEEVMKALNIAPLSPSVLERASEVAQLTATNRSSMLQDITHHRKTEIEQITGFLCQQAKLVDVNAKENEILLRQISEVDYC